MPESSQVVCALRAASCSSLARRSFSSFSSWDSRLLGGGDLLLDLLLGLGLRLAVGFELRPLGRRVACVLLQILLGAPHLGEQALGRLRALADPARAVEEGLRVVAEHQLGLVRQPADPVLGAGGGAHALLQHLQPGLALDDLAGEPDDLRGLFLGPLLGEVVRVRGDRRVVVQPLQLHADRFKVRGAHGC